MVEFVELIHMVLLNTTNEDRSTGRDLIVLELNLQIIYELCPNLDHLKMYKNCRLRRLG